MNMVTWRELFVGAGDAWALLFPLPYIIDPQVSNGIVAVTVAMSLLWFSMRIGLQAIEDEHSLPPLPWQREQWEAYRSE